MYFQSRQYERANRLPPRFSDRTARDFVSVTKKKYQPNKSILKTNVGGVVSSTEKPKPKKGYSGSDLYGKKSKPRNPSSTGPSGEDSVRTSSQRQRRQARSPHPLTRTTQPKARPTYRIPTSLTKTSDHHHRPEGRASPRARKRKRVRKKKLPLTPLNSRESCENLSVLDSDCQQKSSGSTSQCSVLRELDKAFCTEYNRAMCIPGSARRVSIKTDTSNDITERQKECSGDCRSSTSHVSWKSQAGDQKTSSCEHCLSRFLIKSCEDFEESAGDKNRPRRRRREKKRHVPSPCTLVTPRESRKVQVCSERTEWRDANPSTSCLASQESDCASISDDMFKAPCVASRMSVPSRDSCLPGIVHRLNPELLTPAMKRIQDVTPEAIATEVRSMQQCPIPTCENSYAPGQKPRDCDNISRVSYALRVITDSCCICCYALRVMFVACCKCSRANTCPAQNVCLPGIYMPGLCFSGQYLPEQYMRDNRLPTRCASPGYLSKQRAFQVPDERTSCHQSAMNGEVNPQLCYTLPSHGLR